MSKKECEPDCEFIVVFGSTLDAIMSERQLLNAEIAVRVMPMPQELGPSCGIALRLSPCCLEKALPFLNNAKGIFRRDSNGIVKNITERL